jgi:hypothetical protein
MKRGSFWRANTGFRLVVRPSARVRAITHFGPRGVPHDYSSQTKAVARALIMVSPAGFEGFWREPAQLGRDASAHLALGKK